MKKKTTICLGKTICFPTWKIDWTQSPNPLRRNLRIRLLRIHVSRSWTENVTQVVFTRKRVLEAWNCCDFIHHSYNRKQKATEREEGPHLSNHRFPLVQIVKPLRIQAITKKGSGSFILLSLGSHSPVFSPFLPSAATFQIVAQPTPNSSLACSFNKYIIFL